MRAQNKQNGPATYRMVRGLCFYCASKYGWSLVDYFNATDTVQGAYTNLAGMLHKDHGRDTTKTCRQ